MSGTEEITAMLARLTEGDACARDQVFAAVYRKIKALASRQLRNERPNHTLQPTALAHEACLRLLEEPGRWESREHLFRTAAKIMRQILTDYARSRLAQRRGGGNQILVELTELDKLQAPGRIFDLADVLAVDSALEKLKDKDPRQCSIVELRFYVGMSEAEIAEALQVSSRTVRRDWEVARAWLYGQLKSNRE